MEVPALLKLNKMLGSAWEVALTFLSCRHRSRAEGESDEDLSGRRYSAAICRTISSMASFTSGETSVPCSKSSSLASDLVSMMLPEIARALLETLAEVRIPLMSHRLVILVSFSTGFSASGLACPVRIRHLFRWFSRATLGAMPLWLLTYKFTCSQAECGYHNALDAVAQADTPKTAASQVGKSQHLCGRCGRPLTDSSSLKMAVPVPISSVEKKRSVSESGKQPSQNRGSR